MDAPVHPHFFATHLRRLLIQLLPCFSRTAM